MGFIKSITAGKPVHLVLSKDRVRSIKRGHPWIFPEVLQGLPRAPAGSVALLKDKKGDILAKGYYDPASKLAFRAFTVQKGPLDDSLVEGRLQRAAEMRTRLFPDPEVTSGYRLINGEGDGLPGLVIDIYGDVAVVKLDGDGAEGFYDVPELAGWLHTVLPNLRTVFQKYRSGSDEGRGRLITGEFPDQPVVFRENNVAFQADVVMGQKTGFFLDQRDNRARIGRLSKNQRVLNVFGYTGGFSIYAGVAGASHVTTVDLAKPALQFAEANWGLNGLDDAQHRTEAADAFVFLENAVKSKEQWDVVVIDPPSFAPNAESVEKAKASYTRAFSLAAQVTRPNGTLALASCSSHIPAPIFLEVCEEALAKARRQGYILGVHGQPEDHPYPVACEELRYLKFVMYRLEG